MSRATAKYEDSQNVAVLRFGGRELCLAAGRYAIGRAPASDIVISSPLASRQHARLIVTTQGVTVEDLGSANGVAVNGRRIRGSLTLVIGDRITIGGQDIEFREFGSAPQLESTLVGGDFPVRGTSTAESTVESGTYRSADAELPPDDGFVLVGAMAERALAGDRPQDAVNILRYRLAGVLEDAKRGHSAPPAIRRAAIDYACRLATLTHDGKWVDYVLELLESQLTPCPEELAQTLTHAAQSVTSFSVALAERYARGLRVMAPSMDRIRASQHAEALARLAKSRR